MSLQKLQIAMRKDILGPVEKLLVGSYPGSVADLCKDFEGIAYKILETNETFISMEPQDSPPTPDQLALKLSKSLRHFNTTIGNMT
jgi:hypothetical protein